MPELIGKLGYDGRGFSAGMNQALGEAKQASQKMSGYFSQAFSGGLGGGLIGGVAGSLGLGKALGSLNEMAEQLADKFKTVRTGAAELHTDIETFQRIANITQKSGSSPEAFGSFVDRLAVSLEKIRNGEEGFEKLVDAAQELGVSIDDIQKKTSLQIGLQILSGFEGTADPTDALRAALHELGGRSASAMIAAGQIGMGSPTATAGNLSRDQFAHMDMEARVDRFEAANSIEEKQIVGGFWHGILNVFDRLFYGMMHPGAGEEFLIDQEIETTRKEIAREAAAERIKKSKARAETFKAETLESNRKTADAKVVSELEKKTKEIDDKSAKEEEKLRFERLTPAQKKELLENRIAGAPGAIRHDLNLAQIYEEAGKPKDAAQLRLEAAKTRAAADEAKEQLFQLTHKAFRSEAIFDSMARIGVFSAHPGVADRSQEELLQAAQETARNTREIANGEEM